jgi:hypothetical protein
MLYRLLKFGHSYVDAGQPAYEKLYHSKRLRSLRKHAPELGFQLTPKAPAETLVS